MESDDVFEYIADNDERAVVKVLVDETEPEAVVPVDDRPFSPITMADLIVIHKLKKAGFVPSDFE